MEDQCSPLSWGFCYQEEGMEELKHTLLFTTLELETTLISAKEEITRREFELIHLKDVLSRTMKERDEAQGRSQKLMLAQDSPVKVPHVFQGLPLMYQTPGLAQFELEYYFYGLKENIKISDLEAVCINCPLLPTPTVLLSYLDYDFGL